MDSLFKNTPAQHKIKKMIIYNVIIIAVNELLKLLKRIIMTIDIIFITYRGAVFNASGDLK